ncbi:GNAT family N-acetyltransferase [Micromonospora sp. PLK6-60]|uniref:GNAT family N-acetyltransferase n=1 Tax=Micromonospora sp. PLK6-60 TaxID=2873383 RepID=UPI001CA7A1DA|nr:GNAT family N-acetyltransferase [Micromonospora sp. PLK6-60]MBY8870782.1 GNAT family N-acetyltransferase [Micromonospora sp. PLK6-60]
MTDTVRARWVDSAAAVAAGPLDGRFFCTTVAWTRAWEGVRAERVRASRHLVLEGGPAPELVPYYLVDHSPIWRDYEKTAGIEPVWSGPVVFSSTVYGVHGGAGGSSAGYREHAVDLGLEQARRWGAEALVFANLDGAEVDAWSAVRPDGYPVLLDRAYEAPVGGSESAFLGRMTSKPRRELGRQWRRAQESGVRLRVLTGAEMVPRLDEFARLAIGSSEKHTDNIYGPEMFRAVTGVPGAVLLVAEHDDRMVGAFYCFLYRGRLSLVFAGLDNEKMSELNTYAFLMYESLRYAVANGAEVINAGRCNYAYKEKHAFDGADVWALVYQTGSRPEVTDALERMNKGLHEYLAQNTGRE